MFPCDRCTKNFLSSDLLKSHQQRKHSVIEEKHELSDDNEKRDDHADDEFENENENENEIGKNVPLQSEVQQTTPTKCVESHVPQSNNNNNNNNESIPTNCTECSNKGKINSSSIAIQCEVISSQIGTEKMVPFDNLMSNAEKCENSQEPAKYLDNELVQSAYETIKELKKEIMDLKNSLRQTNTTAESKQNDAEQLLSEKDPNITETNDKIDVIEQKFNAFETMYAESQHQFIESFRNLDERQKIYMNSIQETVKDIVEKSLLGQRDIISNDKSVNDSENRSEATRSEPEPVDKIHVESHVKSNSEDENSIAVELGISEQHEAHEPSDTDNDDDDDNDHSNSQTELIFKADVHLSEQSDPHNSIEEDATYNTNNGRITKKIAVGAFEQRLRQFGVEMESVGLSTPRSCEIKHDLAEEREEIKKVIKFGIT